MATHPIGISLYDFRAFPNTPHSFLNIPQVFHHSPKKEKSRLSTPSRQESEFDLIFWLIR